MGKKQLSSLDANFARQSVGETRRLGQSTPFRDDAKRVLDVGRNSSEPRTRLRLKQRTSVETSHTRQLAKSSIGVKNIASELLSLGS
jgi:hypothetical protein